MDPFELIIVGAGPAGVTLAYLLARSGVKVLLIERDATFQREFRGPAYMPVVVEYFNEMGILDEILSVNHQLLNHFSVVDEKQTLFQINLEEVKTPYHFAIAMEQGPFLTKMVELASEFPNFTFLGNSSVTNFNETRVEVDIQGKRQFLQSRLVVAADGRFSTLRELAQIPLEKSEQTFDVLWFDLTVREEIPYELGLRFDQGAILVFIPQERGHVRVGSILQKGNYAALQKEGIASFRERLIAAAPQFKKELEEGLKDFSQCALLDVNIAIAKEWTKDGLLLIGDAAHIASPVGAQGNKLAIQDAIALHPILMECLKKGSGVIRKVDLEPFVRERRKEVEKIFKWQQRMAGLIIGIKNPVLLTLRRFFLPLIQRIFLPHLLQVMGVGYHTYRVATEWFSFHTPYEKLHRYYLLKVMQVEKVTDAATSFYLEIPEELKELFRYKAGQFITLRLLDQGQLHKRCYSLSSTPEIDDYLRITIKRQPQGLISNDLIDRIAVGDELLVLPPAGQFRENEEAKNHIMVAGGSGITPILSLLRKLLQDGKQVTLIYSNHTEKESIYGSTLQTLLQEFRKRFTLHNHFTKENGRITRELATKLLPADTEESAYYLCGPRGLMQLFYDELRKRKIPDERIHTEHFTSLAEPFENVAPSDEKPLVVGDAPLATAETCLVEIRGKNVEVRCLPGETLLDAAIREGLDPPFSCREGICSTCMAKLLEGSVEMKKHDSLSEDAASAGEILTCQAKPLSKRCHIRYE